MKKKSLRDKLFALGLEQIGAATLLVICFQSAARLWAFWVELFRIGEAESRWRVFLAFQKGPGSEKWPGSNDKWSVLGRGQEGVGKNDKQSSMKELWRHNGCDVMNDWARVVLGHGTAWNWGYTPESKENISCKNWTWQWITKLSFIVVVVSVRAFQTEPNRWMGVDPWRTQPKKKQLVLMEPHLDSRLHKATGATTTRAAGETVTQWRRRGSTFWSC